MKKVRLGLLMLISTLGCLNKSDQQQTIPHYDLGNPEKFNLPESLLEISGITFANGNSDTIYAVQDEQGRVFRMTWGNRKQYNTKFGKQGDYEDLAIANGQVLVLKSNGTLFSFPSADLVYEEIDSVREWKKVLPKAEYEGMYMDPGNRLVYVICKNCPDDNARDEVSGFILHAGDSIYQAGRFTINVEKIKAITGKVKRGFRPSGICRNPLTAEWFIISSVNKLLVVTDSSWNIKHAGKLDGNIFNQPEGITFDSKGNLYISNEGDDIAEGNILKFVRS